MTARDEKLMEACLFLIGFLIGAVITEACLFLIGFLIGAVITAAVVML